jgi:galactonate dehydratase
MSGPNRLEGSGITRREVVTTASAFAAAGMLTDLIAKADNPAAQVEDRASAIKITALTPTPLGNKTLIKIETSHKVTGWGEISQLPPKVAVALANQMFDLLNGENPTRVEYLWQKLYRAHRDFRGGAFMVHTISAIDMALWDITGKLYGVPVYRLLGGPTRDKIRMYPTARAVKTAPGMPFPYSGDQTDIQELVKRVKDARNQVGPDGTVMFDCHCQLPPPILIQFAAAIEPYNVLWLEEPAVPGNIEVFKRIKQQVRIPIATGERDRGIWEVIPYLQNNCVDILQPDCGHGGGISQLRKVATLAEAYNVPLAPHSILSYLGQSASLHAVASIPNFLIHEFYPTDLGGVIHKNWELDKTGYASLPQGPGLGVEIDEGLLPKVSAEMTKAFKWPGARYPDGAIADY